MWSLACTMFELATGDYLFEPKKGKNYSKNEDHLALIAELIGECPNTKFLLSGYKSEQSFDKKGRFKNIKKLKMWPLYDVLIEKYRFRELEARLFSDFLLRILKWEPKDRPSAQEMLQHPWLKMIPHQDWKFSRRELREFKKVNGYKVSPSSKSSSSSNG